MLRVIGQQLKIHAPFAAFGAMTGIGIMVLIICARVSHSLSGGLFWTLHPLHVLLSALATTAMYRLHGKRTLVATVLIGYLGSVGIATLSAFIGAGGLGIK